MQFTPRAGACADGANPDQPRQNEESMSILSDDIKEFIVKSLARFDTPSEVAFTVKVNFGVEVSRQQVFAYDPACSQPPASRWRELYAATRQAFLQEPAQIGVANKAVRLQMLERMAQRAEARGNLGLAASLLEQAAKECGGLYDRRQPSVPALPAPAAQSIGDGTAR